MPSLFKRALLLSVMITSTSLAQTIVPTDSIHTTKPDRSDRSADANVRAVAQVNTIKSRRGAKINRFTDAGAREFAVSYDSEGRLASVMATKKRHIADILAVNYDESGTVRAVALGNGEQLYYSPIEGGGRVVRDSGGNLVVLSSSGEVIQGDPSSKLTATALRMESLFKTLQ